MSISPLNPVLAVSAAGSESAYQHFANTLQFETDCWDVNHAFEQGDPGFILIDVRSPEQYQLGHIPGAINMLRGKMIASKLAEYPDSTVFVTYCAGPHCNGATRAAMVLAKLGRPVKIMLGGITGWIDEGFNLTQG